MTKIVNSFSIIAAILTILLCAGAAQAQPWRTWVSGAGSDTGLCIRTAPCKTFGYAYGQTATGGEIDVLDAGDFGPLTIQHALTIASDSGTGGVLNPGGSALTIEAGLTDAIILRGLEINGLGDSVAGVLFETGGSLLVDHCKIYGFHGGAGTTAGIAFLPSGASKLWVTDSVISNSGSSVTGNVLIQPTGGGSVAAQFERVQIVGAVGNGVRVDVTQNGGGGATELELHDVVVDGSGETGIVGVSTSGGAAVTILADTVTSSNNIGYGVRSYGGATTIYLSRSTVTGNNIGLGSTSGGVLASYSDNRIRGNLNSDGAPTTTVPLN